MNKPASRSRFIRIARYLQYMFPPVLMVPAFLMYFAAFYGSLQALAGYAPISLTTRSVIGAVTFVLLSLLLRVYDELKDVETDLRLGRAGDPRYADRPIVTGEVRVEDIVWLRWLTTALLFAINLPLFPSSAFVAFLVCFGLTYASFRWFFYPPMQRNLLLAFITHNPLVAVMLVYALVLFQADFTRDAAVVDILVLLIGLWMPLAAWEWSRKIRLPEQETDYTTYSKIVGWRVATAMVILFWTVATGCVAWTLMRAGFGWLGAGITIVVGCLAIGRAAQFLAAPTPARAELRPVSELITMAISFAVPVAYIIDRGLTLNLGL